MFKNRRNVNRIMYILAIIMVLAMLAITLGPSIVGGLANQ